MQKMMGLFLNQGFSTLTLLTFGTKLRFFFKIKHFPIHGRRFSSVPGCCPVNIMSPSQCDNPKCLYMLAQLCPTLCDSIGGDCQTPLSMGFSRQEYWSGLSFLPSGDVPNPGIEPVSSMPPSLAGGLFYYLATWEASKCHWKLFLKTKLSLVENYNFRLKEFNPETKGELNFHCITELHETEVVIVFKARFF